jgi:aldose 1-epimerase
MESITLRRGALGVTLVPAIGGSIARFWRDAGGTELDFLRPTPPDALIRGEPGGLASFPLVPWSNRIRAGRFTFGGRSVALTPNLRGHAIHGLGYRAPWTVTELGPSEAVLEHRHAGGEWPWAYRATQRIDVTPAGLAVEMALTNESATPMPAGLGWHPYFPRTGAATLHARVTGIWLTDAEILPTVCVTPPPVDRDPRLGLAVDRIALDNVFVGWDREAVITWPERSARLRMTASGPLATLVVYTPPDQAFFCVEPVSHVTEAFNLAAAGDQDTGMLGLAPGESVRAAMLLTPEGA